MDGKEAAKHTFWCAYPQAEADYADQLRADHMAEKHVGELNGDCDLCATEALPPMTDVTNAAGGDMSRPR